MVLAAHGRWVRLEELRVACGVSRDGSRAGNIVRAARLYGLEAKGFRHDLPALRAVPTPAIVFVNLNHFVVLEGFSGNRIFINDPASGRRRLTEEEFDAIYSGVVLTFTAGEAFSQGGVRPRNVARLLAHLRGAKDAVAYATVSGLGLVLLAILLPGFTRVFIDQYLIERQEDWLEWLLAAMVLVALVQGALNWLKGTVTHRLATRVTLRGASNFVWRLLRLPIPFFTQRYAGSLGSRADLVQLLGQHAAREPVMLLVEGIGVIVILGVMTQYSPLLAGVALACVLGNLLLFALARRGIEEREQHAMLDQVKLGSKTMLGLQLIESLKATGTDVPFFEAWSGQHALVVGHQQAIGRLTAAFAVLPEILVQLGTVMVLVLGGWQVMQGEITLGTLVAFQLLQAGLARPMQMLMQSAVQVQAGRGVVDQLDDVLLHPPAPEFTPHPEVAPASPASRKAQRLSGQLTLRGLTFGYSPLEPPLIEGFDLDLPPGARVALVGPSGSGKSTVGRLVTGLFPPWQGEVLLDGVPLPRLPRTLLRNSLAVVDQDIVLFEGSVRDNLALWDETMPDAILVSAARDAMIHDTIIARPGGYDGRVEEGGRNFSGGQRQRLEIARALVGNPSLLVLDEATSALDPVVEKQVMDNLRRRGCACLIIAHRLSTIRDCDEIIVMHRGQVLERGSHDMLIAARGSYSRLIEA
jgi:NHLM bacteriocin system ABC transporter peptidase/ATP-binding protein